ncbi:AI-2E family transporter [Arsenicitalea aurantiaca]|uniref:AI-2E family transporter n=1 Tax=Arsenicitalea aurantiaca TaxID=1783274 RepID=UPI0013155A09|nr:AI-2E family transporter [Arsenicitalea aurantiaca]
MKDTPMADPVIAPPPPPANAGNPLVTAGMIIVLIGALYVGASIFVPLVLAVLLTFALAPVVRFLRRLRLPHIVAVLLAVSLAAVAVAGIGYLIVTQLARLAADLPAYQMTIAGKVEALRETAAGGQVVERMLSAIQRIGDAATQATGELEAEALRDTPIPVTISNAPISPIAAVQAFLGALLGPLATAAIVLVFVIFLLLEREDLRDRFLKLVSRGDLRTSTIVINEAGKRVSRYLLVQLGMNTAYGVLFGLGLWFIGVPNAILWGLLSTLFRYIPFVGTIIAAAIPMALAFAVDPGWSMLLWTLALFIALEVFATNAIEPRLYGNSTGMSALAVIVAAMFWASLWGPIGLILATPLTVCLVVMGQYVPQLQFLQILLGSEPVLAPEERLYQRLMAGNGEEAIEIAEDHLEKGTLQTFYDSVAVPMLRLAEMDRDRNVTDLAHRRVLVDGLELLVGELEDLDDNAPERPELRAARIVCVGGKTELDAAAAEMAAQILRRPNVTTLVMPPVALRPEGIGQLGLDETDIVVICYLGTQPRAQMRYAVRRLRRQAPGLRILACLLSAGESRDDAYRGDDVPVDAVAFSLGEAEGQVEGWLALAAETPALAPAVEQLGMALQRLKIDPAAAETLGNFINGVADRFDAQFALLTLAGESLGEDTDAPTFLPDAVSPERAVLAVPDVAEHAAYRTDPFLIENGLHFFAAAPLIEDGRVIASLAIFDHAARKFGSEDAEALLEEADTLAGLALGRADGPPRNQKRLTRVD